MKRWLTTTLALLVCSAALRADVTIVQTTTIEGGMISAAAAAGAATPSPKMTTYVKGSKTRTDVETGPVQVSTILDLVTRQMIVLRPDVKTATVVSTAPPAGATPPAGPPAGSEAAAPKAEGTFSPTGKSQVIDGVKCDEYSFATRIDIGEMSGRQVPAEAMAMMQGVIMVMQGSTWVGKEAPGAAEYNAYQKAASSPELQAAAFGAAGVNIPGLEKMMKGMSSLSGIAYLTEMTITVEGSGQFAEMMKQMGAMKLTSKVNSITTTALSDDLFKVPEGYSVIDGKK